MQVTGSESGQLGVQMALSLSLVKIMFVTSSFSVSPPQDIRHPEELSLLRKPRDPKKKKKKLEEAEEDDLELEGPLLTPGSGEMMDSYVCMGVKHVRLQIICYSIFQQNHSHYWRRSTGFTTSSAKSHL